MRIIQKETIFSGHYQLNKVFLKSENKEKLIEREQFVTPNSIGVLVFNPEKKELILVKQFRVGPEKELLEIVAGKLEEKDSDTIATLKREVLEEIGYEVNSFEMIHEFHTCPGPVSEKMILYFAEASKKVGEGGGLAEENEEIENIHKEISDFLTTKFIDAKSIIAQQWFQLNLKRFQ